MRLKDDQINRLATKIIDDLMAAELLTLKKERGNAVAAVKEAITADLKKEEEIEKEAERLLEQALRAAGGASIDRHKMLKMIKDKLARDRKVVL